jgi:hypothetical protein
LGEEENNSTHFSLNRRPRTKMSHFIYINILYKRNVTFSRLLKILMSATLYKRKVTVLKFCGFLSTIYNYFEFFKKTTNFF